MQITQRIAIAALALLDPLDEPAEQALDGPLVHGTVVGRLAISVTAAGLPSSFRSHPNPHECDAAENSRGRSGVGLKNSRDTRRSGRNSRWQGGVNFALSGGLLWTNACATTPLNGRRSGDGLSTHKAFQQLTRHCAKQAPSHWIISISSLSTLHCIASNYPLYARGIVTCMQPGEVLNAIT